MWNQERCVVFSCSSSSSSFFFFFFFFFYFFFFFFFFFKSKYLRKNKAPAIFEDWYLLRRDGSNPHIWRDGVPTPNLFSSARIMVRPAVHLLAPW
jgi:hypothetical protein